MPKSKQRLALTYTSPEGTNFSASATDTDGDGKPEVTITIGDLTIGPFESPVQVPDMLGLVTDLIK